MKLGSNIAVKNVLQVYVTTTILKILNMFKHFVYPARIIFVLAYVHLELVVIVFVTQLTCCILVILTVYYIIRGCNNSDERGANVTR